MDEKKNASTISILMTTVLLIFLFIILSFIWCDVLELTVASNFMSGMCFWIINCIILILVFPGKMILTKKFPIGYYAPIILVTVVYTLLLWALMVFALLNIGKMLFILMNLVLLFLYFLIVVPMIISGSNN